MLESYQDIWEALGCNVHADSPQLIAVPLCSDLQITFRSHNAQYKESPGPKRKSNTVYASLQCVVGSNVTHIRPA